MKAFERRALDAALAKTHLPTDDIETPDHLFWRFETADDMPVGFGGLEIDGTESGLSIGTLFTLFVVPAVYMLIATDHSRRSEAEDLAPVATRQSGSRCRSPAMPSPVGRQV